MLKRIPALLIIIVYIITLTVMLYGKSKDEDSFNPKLAVYPNPFLVDYWNNGKRYSFINEVLKIQYEIPMDTLYVIIEVYNVFGKLVYSTGEIPKGQVGCIIEPSPTNPNLSKIIYDKWRAVNNRGAKLENGAYIVHLIIVREPDEVITTNIGDGASEIVANIKISVERR